ncbi:MAG TPA: Na/Pi cotransporter family protein [Burkholderiaceae bacterium]|jgi:phosphate:Na+ symporter|nr:Na/Pi cotransporter family protein [Burkholderiaceae bacterium]
MDHEPLPLVAMLIGLVGGLALFLHGMTMMSGAMRAMAGSRLNDIMARLARNRFGALLTGMGITSIVQSSTVTTLIAIGFVSAGVLTLAQALAVIMGAAVGSAVTTQIIAFDVSNLSYVLTAVGFGLSMWKAKRIASLAGTVIMGLGVLFIGLGLMSDFMAPLRSYPPFLELMANMTNPLLGILMGAVFTAVVNSSTATLGVIIALGSQGLMPLEAGIALVFGANIGTTVTAVIAAIGQPRSALHAAVGLVAYKVLMVLIWLPLMGPLEAIARAVSRSAEGLALTEQLAFEVPRQVANVHLIVNLSTMLLLLPFTNQMAALIVRVFGEEPKATDADALAPELNTLLFDVPALAVDAARREVHHLGERVAEQFEAVIPAILEERHAAFDAVQANERLIDAHHAEIVGFVERLLQPQMPRDLCRTAIDLVEAADYLESIADLIDKEMIPLCRRHAERGTPIGAQAREHLRALAAAIGGELRRALQAVAEADPSLARGVLDAKPQLRSLERAAVHFQIEPQLSDDEARMLPTAFERELAESLRRIYSLIRRCVRAGTDLQRRGVGEREAV